MRKLILTIHIKSYPKIISKAIQFSVTQFIRISRVLFRQRSLLKGMRRGDQLMGDELSGTIYNWREDIERFWKNAAAFLN
jgi:hypothetical protein